MATGNSFVDSLMLTGDLMRKYNQDQATFKQQAATQAFNQQAPQLLAQSGVSQPMADLAAMGLQGGNTTAYDAILKQALSPKQQGDSAVGQEQATLIAKALGVATPEVVTAMSKLPLQQAQMLANQSRVSKDSQANQGMKAEGLNLQRMGQDRLARQELQQGLNVFGNDIKAAEKDIREQASALGTVKQALKAGTKPAQSIVENFLLRNVAGEKGPLSDSDRASFAAKSGFNTFQDAQNYFTGVPATNWTDAQQKAFEDLVNIAEQKAVIGKDKQILDVLGKSELQLVASNDPKGQKEIEKYAKKYGFEKSDGQWSKKVSEKKVPISNETPATELVAVIKDPVKKAQAEAALQAFAGKKIPDKLLEKLKQAAQEQ